METITVTTETFKPYIGGQLEVQNSKEGYIFRGEIESLELELAVGVLICKFAWMAKGLGYPPFPIRWVESDNLSRLIDLDAFGLTDIGPSPDIEAGDRMCFISKNSHQVIVLYPLGGSKLERDQVHDE